MPVTLKRTLMKYKDEDSEYTSVDVIAEKTTAEQVADIQAAGAAQEAAIQEKGEQTRASIPSDYTNLSNEVIDLKSAILEYLIEPGEYYKVNLISGIYQGSIASDGSINPATTNRVVVEFPTEANKRYYFIIAEKDISTVDSIVIPNGAERFNPVDHGRISVSFVNVAFDGICRISCRYDDNATITPDDLTDVYAFEVVAKDDITDISDLSSGYYSFSSQQQVSSNIRVNYKFNANHEKAYSFTAPTGCVLREIVIFNDNDKTKYLSNIQGNTTLKRSICFVPQYIENPAIQIILAKDNASDTISVSDCATINVTEVY